MNPINQKKIEFDNSCNCIVDLGELEKAMLHFKTTPTIKSKRRIYMHGFYPAVTLNGKKIHVHRLLKMYWSKRKLKTSEHVDHINGNKLDARANNLRILSDKQHISMHNIGKKLSCLTRSKISEANRKRKGIKLKKRVDVCLVTLKKMLLKGCSINSIAKRFSCDWTTIRSRINENPELLNQK